MCIENYIFKPTQSNRIKTNRIQNTCSVDTWQTSKQYAFITKSKYCDYEIIRDHCMFENFKINLKHISSDLKILVLLNKWYDNWMQGDHENTNQ